MYNVWDLIGRYIPLFEFLKLESRKMITVAILCRFLLVPAFYFTAKYGDQGWMIMLTSFLGLSNGYLTVCVMTSAPKGYKVRPWEHIIVVFNLEPTLGISSIHAFEILVTVRSKSDSLDRSVLIERPPISLKHKCQITILYGIKIHINILYFDLL